VRCSGQVYRGLTIEYKVTYTINHMNSIPIGPYVHTLITRIVCIVFQTDISEIDFRKEKKKNSKNIWHN